MNFAMSREIMYPGPWAHGGYEAGGHSLKQKVIEVRSKSKISFL